jgi:hypothetical protein
MARIVATARRHRPELLVVDRTVHGEYENYRTPERRVPDGRLPYPWESCIMLGTDWYSSRPNDTRTSQQGRSSGQSGPRWTYESGTPVVDLSGGLDRKSTRLNSSHK